MPAARLPIRTPPGHRVLTVSERFMVSVRAAAAAVLLVSVLTWADSGSCAVSIESAIGFHSRQDKAGLHSVRTTYGRARLPKPFRAGQPP